MLLVNVIGVVNKHIILFLKHWKTIAVKRELDHIKDKYKNDVDRKIAVMHLQRSLDSALRHNKLNLYKTECGKATGLKDGDWDRYIRSSRRY